MLDKTQVTADIDNGKCCYFVAESGRGEYRVALVLTCMTSVLGQISRAFSAEFRGYRNMELGG